MDHSSYVSFTPFQNLKGFATSRPPLIVFLICLITFAITAASLAYFVRRSDLRNPDVTMDWNIVLESFSKLDICVNHNESSTKPVSAVARDVGAVHGTTSGVVPSSFATDSSTLDTVDDFKADVDLSSNVTVSVLVSLKFSPEIQSLPRNILYVSGTVCGKLLGLTGASAEREIPVTFELPPDRHFAACDNTKGCEPARPVCMTFHGLPKLPETRKLEACTLDPVVSSLPNHTHFSTEQLCLLEQLSVEVDVDKSVCHGTILHVVYETNPQLTIMLTERDRTLVNLHLMYTSYFLLVMVTTLLCYAIIRGRPKSKGLLLTDKVPLEG